MNYRQLQYAIMLSETGSFSQLADKLNISQPALSKQILSLEKELEVKLFDRSGEGVVPTAAGEYFLKEAKELLYRENQLLRSMEQFKKGEKGRLTIGTTPFRSAYLLPSVIKQVRDKFPGIQVKLVEEGSELLRKDAAEGKFDLAVINMPVDESQLDAIPIETDRLVLVMPRSLVKEGSIFEKETAICFKDCADIPFVVVGANQEMRMLFEKLCASSSIRPQIAAEVVGLTTAWETARSGAAATLLPMQFVSSEALSDDLKIYELKDNVNIRQPAVVIKHGQFISEYARYAISILTKQR